MGMGIRACLAVTVVWHVCWDFGVVFLFGLRLCECRFQGNSKAMLEVWANPGSPAHTHAQAFVTCSGANVISHGRLHAVTPGHLMLCSVYAEMAKVFLIPLSFFPVENIKQLKWNAV